MHKTHGTVLLIFKSPQDLQTYGTALTSLGYKVLLCESYTEGMNAIASRDVDLVVVNQDTEDLECRSVLDCAAQLGSHPPVLVVAPKKDIHRFFEAMDMGAADYLEDPELHDLLWTIATLVSRYKLATQLATNGN